MRSSSRRGLSTYNVSGDDLQRLLHELDGKPGIDMVAPFGTSLHVSGRDEAELEAAIKPYRKRQGSDLAAVRAVARRRVHRPDEPRAKDNFQ